MLRNTAVRMLVLGWMTAVAMSASAETVTFKSLLKELTDLEGLARMPDPAFTCKQFSSYDRRSTDPAVLTDENWFANGDRGQYLRTEERNGAKEYVLMDADGPGAIVRIWSANPNDAGVVRIYLDGSDTPFVEMSLEDLLKGGTAPFVEPIACMRSKGWNAYLPIPYAKHCKITSSLPDFYYHVNYRTYAAGASVKTLSKEDLDVCSTDVLAVAAALTTPDSAFTPPKGAKGGEFGLNVGAGETKQVAWFPGPAAVYEITMKVDAADLDTALRGTLLQFSVDDEMFPVVLAPLGDFFGTAPGNKPYSGLPCGLRADGTFYSHWVMPFETAGVLRLVNTTGANVFVNGSVLMAPRAWTPDTLYFHAKWRAERDLHTQPRKDWSILFAQGHGRYVGAMLQVTNPVTDWWGEGDEKVYVDSETFPSTFGTGSEDYFGYAWCSPEVYSHAYHSQPRCDGPGNMGNTCVNRYHILDNIPFNGSLRFDIEVWHWKDCQIAQAATAYWYAGRGGKDGFDPPKAEDLVVFPAPQPKTVEGALEGEKMRVVSCTGGVASPQETAAYDWSSAAQMWWRDGQPGDVLTLGFPVDKAGRYEVFAVYTKAPDYGIAETGVNGHPGKPMDFYGKSVAATPEHRLGVYELPAGENQLVVKIVSSNPKAEARHMFGLDYLLLKPVKN